MAKVKQLIEERPDRPVGDKPQKGYYKDGAEMPSSTPMAPPVGYVHRPSIFEQVRAMVRSEALAAAARAEGFETAEEADDFDVGDDYDPASPYEHNFDVAEPPGPTADGPKADEAPATGKVPSKDPDVEAITEKTDAEIIEEYRKSRRPKS